MIRITPFYEHPAFEAADFQQKYLRMVAAVMPFLTEDVLYDDSEGLKACGKSPQKRIRTRNGKKEKTKAAKLLEAYGVTDGDGLDSQLQAEAELAEKIIRSYSEDLHAFLYQGSAAPGRINQNNLRELLLVRLPHGKVPDQYRFDLLRSTGSKEQQKKRAKDLYEYVFRYEAFSSLRSDKGHCGIHELIGLLGVKVCPYCNRLYTTTVNTKKCRVRPQLDHFRNKSDYPFLALSINNLVPACGVCNLLKSNQDKDLVYPYDEDFSDEDRIFRSSIPTEHTVPALEGIRISEQDFEIMIECRDPGRKVKDTDRSNRIDNSIRELALTELYQSHRDYIAFLYRQRYILTKQVAQDYFRQFSSLFKSAEEVEDVFTLMYTDLVHWSERPLGKLTHDIIAEIDTLYAETDLKCTPYQGQNFANLDNESVSSKAPNLLPG